MSMSGRRSLLDHVAHYYSSKLAEHGATSKGVDWNSEASQFLRFRELSRTVGIGERDSVLDFGCGFGSLLPVLRVDGYQGQYSGFDISPEMIAQARKLHGEEDAVWLTELPQSARYDFVVASGIFNVRLGHSIEEWRDYLAETIDRFHELALKGFAFNVLTAYSDEECQRDDLFYADPLEWFDHCKRRMSNYVVLNHGYPLYEFTLAVLYGEDE